MQRGGRGGRGGGRGGWRSGSSGGGTGSNLNSGRSVVQQTVGMVGTPFLYLPTSRTADVKITMRAAPLSYTSKHRFLLADHDSTKSNMQ